MSCPILPEERTQKPSAKVQLLYLPIKSAPTQSRLAEFSHELVSFVRSTDEIEWEWKIFGINFLRMSTIDDHRAFLTTRSD